VRGTEWIDWTRTKPQPDEREHLLTALTSEQKGGADAMGGMPDMGDMGM
jgi:hypothetical protein